jgi:MoaA/NifB/PqqE/SkfB family radical SAM enzyme
MKELPKTICMLPWMSIETSPLGTARPCCLSREEITDENGVKYDLKVTDLETVYKSQYMQDMRKALRNGEKPAACKLCWDEEDAGRTSKRINSRIRLKELYEKVDWENDTPDQLWFIDLKLGNICNLKCRICGSWSSSKWAQEEMAYLPEGRNKKEHIAYTWLKQGAWPRQTETFWKNLREMLPQIKYFEFTGGEPWMIQEHIELLKFAVETGESKHIDIHYNTNATQYPTDLVSLWEHFGRVDIAFSVDNVGDRFEYERYGADWNVANKIIDDVHALRQEVRNITTQLCFTINIQNVYYLDELLHWADTKNFNSVYFNMMHSPDHMSIQNMTLDANSIVIEKLKSVDWKSKYYAKEIQQVINFIENGSGSDGSEFLMKMKRTDEFRNEDFSKTHSEIARAMGYE